MSFHSDHLLFFAGIDEFFFKYGILNKENNIHTAAVFDSNRETLWEQGHLPGAVAVGQETFPPEVLPADRGAALAFYCRDLQCLTAYLSAGRARSLGYTRVFVLEGGREAWAQAGLPLVAEPRAESPVDLED